MGDDSQGQLPIEQPLNDSEHGGANQTGQQSHQEKLPVLPSDVGVRLVGAGSRRDHGRTRGCGVFAGIAASWLLLRVKSIEQKCHHHGTDQTDNHCGPERAELPPPERVSRVRKKSVFDRHISPATAPTLTRTIERRKQKRVALRRARMALWFGDISGCG